MSELSAKPEARDMELAPTRLRRKPRVFCDPSGWDCGKRSLTLPDQRNAGDCEG